MLGLAIIYSTLPSHDLQCAVVGGAAQWLGGWHIRLAALRVASWNLYHDTTCLDPV